MKRNNKLTWPELMTKKEQEAKIYTTSSSYYVGDYIKHQSFGVGYVQDSFSNKLDVLFEDKARTLVHMVMF